MASAVTCQSLPPPAIALCNAIPDVRMEDEDDFCNPPTPRASSSVDGEDDTVRPDRSNSMERKRMLTSTRTPSAYTEAYACVAATEKLKSYTSFPSTYLDAGAIFSEQVDFGNSCQGSVSMVAEPPFLHDEYSSTMQDCSDCESVESFADEGHWSGGESLSPTPTPTPDPPHADASSTIPFNNNMIRSLSGEFPSSPNLNPTIHTTRQTEPMSCMDAETSLRNKIPDSILMIEKKSDHTKALNLYLKRKGLELSRAERDAKVVIRKKHNNKLHASRKRRDIKNRLQRTHSLEGHMRELVFRSAGKSAENIVAEMRKLLQGHKSSSTATMDVSNID